jgi:hypothetical protein
MSIASFPGNLKIGVVVGVVFSVANENVVDQLPSPPAFDDLTRQ